MKKRIFCLFLLELVVVSLLTITWEFWLEDLSLVKHGRRPETTDERLEYVITSFVFVLIALIYPFLTIKKSIVNLEKANEELETSLNEIKTLKRLLSMCAHCKKIRAENGVWQELEDYMWEHAETQFSHGICPDCTREFYREFNRG